MFCNKIHTYPPSGMPFQSTFVSAPQYERKLGDGTNKKAKKDNGIFPRTKTTFIAFCRKNNHYNIINYG